MIKVSIDLVSGWTFLPQTSASGCVLTQPFLLPSGENKFIVLFFIFSLGKDPTCSAGFSRLFVFPKLYMLKHNHQSDDMIHKYLSALESDEGHKGRDLMSE